VLNAAPTRALAPDLIALVDLLIVNAVEAEMMGANTVCCLHSAADAARHLAAKFESVIVTAGSKGLAAVAPDDTVLTLPAQKVELLSSHGAGDAFIGTLCSALVQGVALDQAATIASHAAALHVSRPNA
jgi:ribokinase